VQDHAAHELDIEVPHLEHAPAGFTQRREGFDQEVVERGPVVQLLLELRGLGLQLGVGELLHLALESVDGVHDRLHAPHGALV
jgi:hypothetical protein